uniref:Zinc finger CCHC domain-containing protein 7 n=1 Tax=Oryzias melastigma TaxID=30732 RepID=A0A3B3BRT0_ORYME
DVDLCAESCSLGSHFARQCVVKVSKDTTYGTVRQSGRYFTEKTFYCGNCSMMGHLSRSCPDSLKPCFICGALGHLGDKCPNNYCSNCYQPGHTSKTCSEIPCGKKQCQRCGMKGHFSDGICSKNGQTCTGHTGGSHEISRLWISW